MVLVKSAFPLSQMGETLHEFNRLHPFHLLESELQFISKSERGSMGSGKILPVHFVGQDRLRVAQMFDLVDVIIKALSLAGPMAEGVEDSVARMGLGSDHGHDVQ